MTVDRLNDDTILIYLVDGTVLHVTVDQLLNSCIPRYPVPDDDQTFQSSIRTALDRAKSTQ